ncbi:MULTISPECIES: penicillin-binding protein activator LpoB [Erwiniaceae]|uniref:Penicillin-binding protein activator LpoB n=1 Tax=Erwinia billingiae (strain Eb661) TaxID=634500 RepID=D8MQU0_ERWBE|nr:MULTISPECIES: penicillin-binding protein activator LpoB [Erwinia]MBN7121877.1 penicillin-binding protein activator LpoB [Erwinia billingiae]MCX0499842.1 penicillin-binding protein activator LpoB [Erwinia billingiae]QBR51327.1 penicillin-binding protein activator LpoB [Erwinia sp. QL-Z3]QEW32703.1 penicillin-binding protein activator LpoB [Erwinia billingiae]CAX59197.1 Putative lipoprotein [Erwinia billingiae Eb661]
MERKLIKLSGVVLLALILAGCVNEQQQPQKPAPVEPVQPTQPVQPPVEPPPAETVPQPPKFQSINWDASVSPLIAQMLKADGVTAGSVLLVDGVKNSTNGSLQISKATAALHTALDNNTQFTLVTPQQLATAKQTLGLSAEDSLGSRSKAVGLARIVGAQYVLYSNVQGDVKTPSLQMQLMLVQTGEIIWSGNGVVQH